MKKLIPLMFILTCFIGIDTVMSQDDATVKFDDHNVYHFKTDGRFKSYVDVLCTPLGRNVLRDAPADHLHHHGLMFAIKVDDINFWEETDETFGKQVIFSRDTNANVETIDNNSKGSFKEKVTLDWLDGSKKVLLNEQRTIQVEATNQHVNPTMLTWTTAFTLPEGTEKAKLGGNHYHGLGMRFDKSMDKGGEFFTGEPGTIENFGSSDERLTPCKWMAYTANLKGHPVTIAVFDSPKNPRPMLVFTMGDVNAPFAYMAATINLFREPLEMTKDKPVTFCYGVAVWEGKLTPKEVAEAYKKWLE